MTDEEAELEFREALLAELSAAGRRGVRVTPANVAAAAYLI